MQCLRSAALCTGSILFTLSCFTGLFQIMASHSLRNRLCVAYPYAAGSLLYTWGAYCTMMASADALRQLEVQGGTARMQGQAATSGQPVQTPAVQMTGARACEAPTACRAIKYTPSPEAGGCEPSLLNSEQSACCSATPQKKLIQSSKSLHKAGTTQGTHEQIAALLNFSVAGRKQHFFTLQLSSTSAHGWATLDLAGR